VGLFDSLRRAGLRLILKNALALEEEIYGHFLDLPENLAGQELPPSLQAIVQEEREHRRLLEELAAGRLEEEELQKALAERGVHRLEEVRPLEARYEPIRAKLGHIAEHERAIYEFFRSLQNKSTLPFAKRAFRLLAEQEQVHVQLLERLLG
jgi:rubrerythrin